MSKYFEKKNMVIKMNNDATHVLKPDRFWMEGRKVLCLEREKGARDLVQQRCIWFF